MPLFFSLLLLFTIFTLCCCFDLDSVQFWRLRWRRLRLAISAYRSEHESWLSKTKRAATSYSYAQREHHTHTQVARSCSLPLSRSLFLVCALCCCCCRLLALAVYLLCFHWINIAVYVRMCTHTHIQAYLLGKPMLSIHTHAYMSAAVCVTVFECEQVFPSRPA